MLHIISRITLFAVLLTCAGCGGGGTERTLYSVTGKVTFGGQAVTEGSINFEDTTTGLAGSALLGADGAYSTQLAAADYKVTIVPPMEITPDTANSPGETKPKEVANIPAKYRARESSDLTATVSADKTEHNFTLAE